MRRVTPMLFFIAPTQLFLVEKPLDGFGKGIELPTLSLALFAIVAGILDDGNQELEPPEKFAPHWVLKRKRGLPDSAFECAF